jgi:hypothetical protein
VDFACILRLRSKRPPRMAALLDEICLSVCAVLSRAQMQRSTTSAPNVTSAVAAAFVTAAFAAAAFVAASFVAAARRQSSPGLSARLVLRR